MSKVENFELMFQAAVKDATINKEVTQLKSVITPGPNEKAAMVRVIVSPDVGKKVELGDELGVNLVKAMEKAAHSMLNTQLTCELDGVPFKVTVIPEKMQYEFPQGL